MIAFHLTLANPKIESIGALHYNTAVKNVARGSFSFSHPLHSARPQQHFLERAATTSLRDQVTRQQKCKLLCLVVFEKGCQFLTVYSGRAVKIPLNRDHGKN